MKSTMELKSWEEFCSEIDRLKDEFNNLPILFRGQADHEWQLETTLERFTKRTNWSIKIYCKLVVKCIEQISSLKNLPNDAPSISDIEQELEQHFHKALVNIPNSISYYWTYLRHYGFPSPLLDWSLSPNIAAFFAFSDFSVNAEKVAIYAFIDTITDTKHTWVGQPQITAKWLNVHTNERHRRQESLYTVATTDLGRDHIFDSHDQVFSQENTDQDILKKYIIPSSESMKALAYLDHKKNINHYYLMNDEESLLKAIAFREILQKNL